MCKPLAAPARPPYYKNNDGDRGVGDPCSMLQITLCATQRGTGARLRLTHAPFRLSSRRAVSAISMQAVVYIASTCVVWYRSLWRAHLSAWRTHAIFLRDVPLPSVVCGRVCGGQQPSTIRGLLRPKLAKLENRMMEPRWRFTAGLHSRASQQGFTRRVCALHKRWWQEVNVATSAARWRVRPRLPVLQQW